MDEAHEPGVYEELEEQRSRILKRIRRCDLASVRRFAHEERRKMGLSYFKSGAMRISDWHAISELLVLTQTEPSKRLHTPGGGDEAMFEGILGETSAWSERTLFLEDLRTGRYQILRRHDGNLDFSNFCVLKYLVDVRKGEGAFGLAQSLDQVDDESMFEYAHIEAEATPSPPPIMADFGELLETLWPSTLHFRHALRSHWRTSQLYNYQPQLVDFSVLAGYWKKCSTDETCRIPAEREKDEFEQIDAHLRKHSCGKVTASEFVKRYVDCEEQAPIIVRTPNGWQLDKASLLLFILYLQGEPNLVDKKMPRMNEPLLTRMQTRAGREFETWIRGQLSSKGYRGPDEPVNVRAEGQSFEYDVLMVSEADNTIVVADAKYRDVSPSSLTGENLLSQELLGDHGLLPEAKWQEDRISFFLQNQSAFERHLVPEKPWTSYRARSYLVTKSVPLISQYGGTHILRARDFLASIP